MATMITDNELRKDFADRLNLACSYLSWEQRGRPAKLQKLLPFDITEKGVRKWFVGEGMPSPARIAAIATTLYVNGFWLQTGEGDVFNYSPDTSRDLLIRVLSKLKERNLSKAQFCSLIDETEFRFDTHLKLNCFYTQKLPEISNALNVSIDWLLTGNKDDCGSFNNDVGDPIPNKEMYHDEVESIIPESADLDKYALISQYRDVRLSAGHGNYAPNHEKATSKMAFKRSWLQFKGFKEKYMMIVYADGDSMMPRIHDKDVLLVDTSDKTFSHGTVCAINYGGMALVKRLTRKMDGSVLIQSDNPDKNIYPDESLLSEEDGLVVIGRCVWVGGDI